MTSWKTTLCGVLAIIAAVALAGKAALSGGIGSVDFAAVASSVMAGMGLILAKDHSGELPSQNAAQLAKRENAL